MTQRRVGLDFNCSPRLVGALGALYGHHGFEFIHLEKLVAGTTEDETWADVFKGSGGLVVISGDSNIAYKPHQAIAFIDNGFLSFFPEEAWCRLRGNERSALLIHAWPSIQEKIADAQWGTCWRIPCHVQNAASCDYSETFDCKNSKYRETSSKGREVAHAPVKPLA